MADLSGHMNLKIHSIQIGTVRTEGDPDSRDSATRQWTTGFYKQPVVSPVSVESEGITGDAVADTKHHGGPDKAILCYAQSHYGTWKDQYPNLEFEPGGFGENLTVAGATEEDVCIGDVFDVGSCQVQISQPRQPCWKISRRWGVKTLTKEVAQSGRTGWYLRIIQKGQLKAGDVFKLTHRPNPDWSVSLANDLMFGRQKDADLLRQLAGLSELAEAWRKDLS